MLPKVSQSLSRQGAVACVLLAGLLLGTSAWIYLAVLPTWVQGSSSDLVRTARQELDTVQSLERELLPLLLQSGPAAAAGHVGVELEDKGRGVGPSIRPPVGQKWVLAFDLFGSHDRYNRGALANAALAALYYPGWIPR